MTKKVVFRTCTRLSCIGVTPPPTVILCLTDAALLAPSDCPGTTLEATLTKSWKDCDACNGVEWVYVFAYDENLLADPNTALLSTQINGVFCKGCLTTWVEDQVACAGGGSVCVADSDTIDFSLDDDGCVTGDVKISADAGNIIEAHADGIFAEDEGVCVADSDTIDLSLDDAGCVTGDVKISADAGNIIEARDDGIFAEGGGEGGNDWHITGNSDIVDGVNYLGTSNNVAVDLRVNNVRARRTEPYTAVPSIVDGYFQNKLISFGGYIPFGSGILSGGQIRNPSFPFVPLENYINGAALAVICGGSGNAISAGDNSNPISGQASIVGGGFKNTIFSKNLADPASGTGNTYCNGIFSGNSNHLFNQIYSCLVGGISNEINSQNVNIVNYAITGGSSFAPGGEHFLGGGVLNSIRASSAASSIVSGSTNTINNAYFSSCILSGLNHIISYSSIVPPASLLAGASVIIGGQENSIFDGDCSTILGGGGLTLGANSFGYQNPLTRSRSTGDPRIILTTDRVDLTAFNSLAYFGDIDLWIANTNSTPSKAKFFEPNSSITFTGTNYSSFEAQAQGANIEYIWPAAQPTVGQSLKCSGVSGNRITLVWG